MDVLERMYRDEREALDFFLKEEFKEKDMEQSDIQVLRKRADDLYGKAGESTPEEAIALQCSIQTVIAEQLVRIAEALENLVSLTPR